MRVFSTLRTASTRPRTMRLAAVATVATAAALALVTSDPASAGAATSAVAPSSRAAGDVLFWSRLTDSRDGHSIVKASAAAPSLIATVLAGSSAASFSGPEVSPDGTKLAYIRDSYPTTSLEVRDLGTGSTTVLASRTGDPPAEIIYHLKEPTWSPSGDTIAYIDTTNNACCEFPVAKVVPSAGGASRTVQEWAHSAAWRPDGRLTVARRDPGTTATGLWVTGATPNDAVIIPGSDRAEDHAWSPDGTQVAFTRPDSRFESVSLETLPAAGGTATVIVPANGDFIATPAWSSDGQRIYFTAASDYYSSHIKQVPRTGGAVSAVVTGGRNVSPSVAPKVAAPVPSRSHDFNGDGYADVIGRMSNGDLRLYYGNGLRLSGYRRIGTGWSGMTAIFTPGDFDGDGHPDVIGRMPNGDLRLYTGVGGGPAGSRVIGTGWNGLSAVFSPGDFTGDGHPDVIARMPNGDLRLYFGTGVRLSGYRVIGIGWNGITAVFSPGDFNGDNRPDVIGRSSSGDLRVYYGTGTTLSGSAVIGIGWNGLSALFSPGDFNLDGLPDVIGRISNGDLRVYYGNGTRLSGYRVIGTGWNSVNPLL